jgi:hypothetical protein
MGKVRTSRLIAAAVLACTGVMGCMPFSAGIFTPIPVPPWVTERMEEKYCHKNDYRTTILPPIPDGAPPPICEDPPSIGEVLRAMPHVKRGFPYVCEEFRDDVRVINERLVDKIDPPRFFPLVGPAQLHHCHWKCTIYYRETVQTSGPWPVKIVKNRVEVVYIDKDHLHLYVGPNPRSQAEVTRDLAGN